MDRQLELFDLRPYTTVDENDNLQHLTLEEAHNKMLLQELENRR